RLITKPSAPKFRASGAEVLLTLHSQDPSFPPDDQFSIEVSSFIVTSIPGTGIKLLRARSETEKELARRLDIPRRIELLRRTADASEKFVQNAPKLSPDIHFLQDVALIGHTSVGENVYL